MYFLNPQSLYQELMNQPFLEGGDSLVFAFSDAGDPLENHFEVVIGDPAEYWSFKKNVSFARLLSSCSNFLDSASCPNPAFLSPRLEALKKGERPSLSFQMPLLYEKKRRFVSILILHSQAKGCFIAIARRLQTVELEIADYYERTIHDVTTGLLNKEECLKAVNAITVKERDTYLIFLDLVRFKLINDVYGHMVGDDILSIFGAALKASKPKDSEVYRFGGDEFVAILKKAEQKDVLAFFKRLSDKLSMPNKYGIRLAFSAGATKNEESFSTPLLLIRCSDHGMYQAKRKSLPYYIMSSQDCEQFLPDE